MRQIILIFLLIISYQNISACTCDYPDVNSAMKYNDAIFLGKVISIEKIEKPVLWTVNDTVIIPFQNVKLIQQKIYKGRFQTDTITIQTENGTGMCGFPFQIGEQYIIYANWTTYNIVKENRKSQYLYTSICTRTTNDINKEIEAIYYSSGLRFRRFRLDIE